ncbi:MAG: RNA polymerase sigma factor [Actinomycetota bacterium]
MKYSSLTVEELIQVCAYSEDPDAWAEFVRRFHKLIASVVVRIAYAWDERSNAVIEDLVQDTYIKICANNRRLLRKFKSRHPDAFYGMLKVTAGNVARDYFRARDSEKRGSGLGFADFDTVECFVPDGHAAGAKQIELEILIQQIDRVLVEKCSTRDRQIFWLYYRQGFTAQEIATISSSGPETKGIESVLHRLRVLLAEALVQGQNLPESEGISEPKAFTKGEGQR